MPATLREVLKTNTFEQQRQIINTIGLDFKDYVDGNGFDSRIRLVDGTLSNPALFFNSDDTYGFYKNSSKMVFGANNTKIFSLEETKGFFYSNLEVGTEGIGELTPTGVTSGYDPGTYNLTISGGSGSGAQIQFDVVNYDFNITSGSDYVPGTYQEVPLTGGSGSGAAATIIVSGVEGTITQRGSGYGDTVYPAVTLSGGSGNGDITADLLSSGGEIVSVTILNSGTGYQNGDVLSYTGAGNSDFQYTINNDPYIVTSVSLTADTSYSINDVLTTSNANLGGSGSGFEITLTDKGYVDPNSITITSPGSGYILNETVTATNPLVFTVSFVVSALGDSANLVVDKDSGSLTTLGQINAPTLSITDGITVSNSATIDGVYLQDNIISTSSQTDLVLTTSSNSNRVVISGRDFAVTSLSGGDVFSVDNEGNVVFGGADGGSGSIAFGTLQIIDNSLKNTAIGYNSFGSIVTIEQTSSGSGYPVGTVTGVSITGGSGSGGIASFVISPWDFSINSGTNYVNGSYSLVDLFVDTGVTRTFAVVNNGSSAFTVSGTDKNGSVSGDNPTITCDVGDSLEFQVNASGHPFYIQNIAAPYSSSDVIPAVTNGGAELGTVRWRPSSPGTYYYVCGIHTAMSGVIVVDEANVTGVNADIIVSGNAITSVEVTDYGTNYSAGMILVANYGDLGGTLGPSSAPPSNFYITIGNAGIVTNVTLSDSGTNYLSGDGIGANIAPNYIAGLTNLNGGSGYADGDFNDVSFQTGDGVDKEIESVLVSNPGSGLTDNIYYGVNLIGGTGSSATADVTVINGSVSDVSIVNAGSGYTLNDSLSITELSGVVLTVSSIVPSAGLGATANITVSSGIVTNVEIVIAGSNYVVGDLLTVDPNFDGVGNGSNFSIEVSSVSSGAGWSGEITSINGSGILIQPADNKLVKVLSTSALVIPVGDGSERPQDAETGAIRYNTENRTFEGYDGEYFVSLGGVKDVSGSTYISAELYPSRNDSTLSFYNDNLNTLNVTKEYFNLTNIGTLRSVDIEEGLNNEIATYWESGLSVDPSDSNYPIEYIYFEDRLYQVTSAGSLGISGPDHTSGAVENGSAELTFVRSIYKNLDIKTANLTLETFASSTLSINSQQLIFNTDLSLKDFTFYKNSGFIGFGFNSTGSDNLFLKFVDGGSQKASIVIDSGWGTGVPNEIEFLDTTLKYTELLYTKNEIDRLVLVKGTTDTGTITLYDNTLYSGARVYIVADNITSGQKQVVEYNVIDDGTDIYSTKYNEMSTVDGAYQYTANLVFSGTNVNLDFTVATTLNTSDEVKITMSKVLIKK